MLEDNVRHLRRVAPPLAGYFRVGHRDAALVTKLLEQGLPTGSGVIVDPAAQSRTSELRGAAVENGVEVILDPKSVELSTVGGMASSTVANLPWAHPEPHTPSTLTDRNGEILSTAIAQSAIDQRVTGVLAPTHFLDADPQWLDVDVALTSHLRSTLDENQAGSTVIYYPLVASLRALNDTRTRTRVLAALTSLITNRQIDGVFLRIQGFGTTKAGPRNLRTYLNTARQLHDLGVPLVGERTGTIGVALAAFGAIGGIESSITYGEGYDARRLNKPPTGKGFVPPPRVYIKDAKALVSKQDGSTIVNRRGFARLGCQQVCCGRDRQAILDDPRRHFLVTRSHELTDLSTTPETDRAEHYLTTSLTPARDNAAQLARFLPDLATHRNRLDDWYLALRRTLEDDAKTNHTTALAPTGRRLSQSA